MSLNKKQIRNLKVAMKRREERPVSTYAPPAKLKVTAGERNRITNSNPRMLLAIESQIVATWKKFPELDDHNVQEALTSFVLKRNDSDDSLVRALIQELEGLGERWTAGEGPDNEDWTTALRVILDSVKTRSGPKGTRNYLAYASAFVARAR